MGVARLMQGGALAPPWKIGNVCEKKIIFMLYKENWVKSGEVFQTKFFAPPCIFFLATPMPSSQLILKPLPTKILKKIVYLLLGYKLSNPPLLSLF